MTLLLAPEGDGEADSSSKAEAEGKVHIGTTLSSKGRSDRDRSKEKWIHRWAPENNMGELGIYLGVLFPSVRHELFAADAMLPADGFRKFKIAAPDVGARAGYYPIRFFGIEAEGGVMPTQTRGNDAGATLWTVRGHAVAQLGLWSITPFVLAGAGAFSVNSGRNAVGDDVDAALHFGVGAKFYLNRWTMLRLDLRDILSAERGVADGVTQSFEILVGFSVTLGRKKDKGESGAKDTDGDGIPDWRDRCDEDPGPKPSGCPPDTDGDGLHDGIDKCPTEPETKNRYDDDDGCPDAVPKEIDAITGVIKGVHFDTDKASIKPESKKILDDVAEQLKTYPGVTVEIVGHTDSTGSRDHNLDLSRRRAESVAKYLVDKGVDEGRITTRGAGPDEPIADNGTKEGRAENRRIEFVVSSSGGAGPTVERSKPEPEGPEAESPQPEGPEPAADADDDSE